MPNSTEQIRTTVAQHLTPLQRGAGIALAQLGTWQSQLKDYSVRTLRALTRFFAWLSQPPITKPQPDHSQGDETVRGKEAADLDSRAA